MVKNKSQEKYILTEFLKCKYNKQDLKDAAKTVLRKREITLKAHARKEKSSSIDYLSFYPKKLEKESIKSRVN